MFSEHRFNSLISNLVEQENLKQPKQSFQRNKVIDNPYGFI